MLAKDIMTTQVVTVRPDTSVVELARIMRDRHISGMPVVGDDGRIAGVVSEGDLVRRVEAGTDEKRHSWWLDLFTDPARQARDYVKSHAAKARDIMTSPAITVEEDATLAAVAETLEKNHVKRVPVVRNGRVVGIVSRANIVQLIASARRVELPPVANDNALRDKILETLRRQPWAPTGMWNVTVSAGVVELWGIYASEEERAATRVAIENINGVKRIEDHRAHRTTLVSGV